MESVGNGAMGLDMSGIEAHWLPVLVAPLLDDTFKADILFMLAPLLLMTSGGYNPGLVSLGFWLGCAAQQQDDTKIKKIAWAGFIHNLGYQWYLLGQDTKIS